MPPAASIAQPAPLPRTPPIETTLDLLGAGCRPLVLWHLFWGARPFGELLRSGRRLTKKALRQELAELQRSGLVRKDAPVKGAQRAEYRLTSKGETLKPLLAMLYEWGLRVEGTRDTP